MRIISGKYKGKKLKEFELNSTRPTLDRVKESIFNLVQFEVLDAVCLDLFSGTGALGVECVSRGAKKTYLIDNNPQAIQIIKANTNGLQGDFEVIKADAFDFLKTIKTKFDLVFLDPPFKTDLGTEAIDFIIQNDLLKDNGIIIFETDLNHQFNTEFMGYKTTKKAYGTVAVYKIEKL